ncbi:MAG: peptide chain release factor N(5)-glutamine methyltransferase [Alphaproteobacteria bacterium]|nr:peptide chain release factor N(5)-glutamine methyltransferase [Alphaproteobacteria bacterium]
MNINQAFSILQSAGGVHVARIIMEKHKKISFLRVFCYAAALRRGVPVAKIIHSKWFYGLEFYTNKHTLDPRPDTETLITSVIKDYPDTKERRVIDLGTGTGCIICSLCKNINGLTGIGIDKSKRALHVAKKNVKNLGLRDRIKIKHGDFTNFKSKEQFDIIVSNPPYIAYGDTRINDAAKFDPKIALYADNNGLSAYERIAKNAVNLLKPNGKIYLEIGVGQSNHVIKIFKYFGWKFERVEPDLSGINRVLVFTL